MRVARVERRSPELEHNDVDNQRSLQIFDVSKVTMLVYTWNCVFPHVARFIQMSVRFLSYIEVLFFLLFFFFFFSLFFMKILTCIVGSLSSVIN